MCVSTLSAENIYKHGFSHGTIKFNLKQDCIVSVFMNVRSRILKQYKQLDKKYETSRTVVLKKGANEVQIDRGYYILSFEPINSNTFLFN
jgi:hypothetical protein